MTTAAPESQPSPDRGLSRGYVGPGFSLASDDHNRSRILDYRRTTGLTVERLDYVPQR